MAGNLSSAFGAVSAAAGAITNVVGAFYSAAGNRIALRSQADMARINARLAAEKGRQARRQGEAAIVARRMETGRNRADLRVTSAASGVDVGEGTAANAIATNDIIGEIDALTIDANAIREQGSAGLEASNYNSQANTALLTASAISPFADAMIAAAGSASAFASRYVNWGSAKSGTPRLRATTGGTGATSGRFTLPTFPGMNYGARTVR